MLLAELVSPCCIRIAHGRAHGWQGALWSAVVALVADGLLPHGHANAHFVADHLGNAFPAHALGEGGDSCRQEEWARRC